MMRGRIASALYALVLALAACGLVATHARTLPAVGVAKMPAIDERSADAIAEDGVHAGRALQEMSATPACNNGASAGCPHGTQVPLSLYVSLNCNLQYWSSHACPLQEPPWHISAVALRVFVRSAKALVVQARLQTQWLETSERESMQWAPSLAWVVVYATPCCITL